MLENREISEVSDTILVSERLGKTCGHNPNMNAAEKSDIGILPKKEPNNARNPISSGGSGGKADDRGEISGKTDCDLHAEAGVSIERT